MIVLPHRHKHRRDNTSRTSRFRCSAEPAFRGTKELRYMCCNETVPAGNGMIKARLAGIGLLILAASANNARGKVQPLSPPGTAQHAQAHAPSAFQLEQRMSFAQLMNRWNPNIAAAAKRFNVAASWVRAVMQVESGGRTMMG